MKNTLYEGYLGLRLPQAVQIERVKRVMREELTPLQRETLAAYYLRGMSISQFAQERGVNKSTVCRTLHRAEAIVRRYLRY